jgi:hypothetical protein
MYVGQYWTERTLIHVCVCWLFYYSVSVNNCIIFRHFCVASKKRLLASRVRHFVCLYVLARLKVTHMREI